jgi:hypothetical protein
MNEEDTIYKYLAGITRIIWKLWRCVRCWCLMPVILATQEVDIRKIIVQTQVGKQSMRHYLYNT